jgi:uncharacterized protein YegL
MKKGLTELVFILDKSGSMGGLESDTIGGCNAMLDRQKTIEGDCRVTTVLFDNDHELLHDRADIRAVSPLTDKEYQVGGSTSLLDAIGSAIDKIGNALKHTADDYRPEKVMFVIVTDGEENSSREYTFDRLRSLIERQKSRYGWEFVFLGANIDAARTAGRFGIAPDRAVDYLADSEGTKLNFKVMSAAVKVFRETGAIDGACFEEIREDVRRRGRQKRKQ